MTKTRITIYGCEQGEAALFRELAPRFGIAPIITSAELSEDNTDLARGSRYISVSHKANVTSPVLSALAQAGVRYVSTRSAGYDHIDVDFARSVGISVGNVMYSPDSVADYTVMLMLMIMRNARSTIDRVRRHDFRLDAVRGRELRDITVGVVGTGRIGAAVIDRLRGFGCRILAYDHHPKIQAEYVSLDELLDQSDIVTLHTPLDAGTYHLLNRRRLARMKRGALIINTARGSLIDTEALITALESGQLGGAALDVLEGEKGVFYADYRKRVMKHAQLLRLLALPHVLVTPHAAYYTEHALEDIVKSTIINCLQFEKEKVA